MAITISGSGITSANIADGTIVNADVADVAASKLTGALPAIDGSALTGVGGLTEVDQWRIHTDITGNAAPITTNLERNDTSFEKIGIGMTEVSGVFSFPSTGKWQIEWNITHGAVTASDYGDYQIQLTTDNSTYTQIASATTGTTIAIRYSSGVASVIVDIIDVANYKIRFSVTQSDAGNKTYNSSTRQRTGMTFLKLGDT